MATVGYRFLPSDEELLSFLRKKVNGEDWLLPTDLFTECNIYGGENREPWNLFDKSSNQILYVFTPLNKKSKSRIDRVAGSGFWDCKSKKEKIKEDLGFKKCFVFKIKNGSRDTTDNGNWVMHEFSLPDDNSFVLCKIRNKDALQETQSCLENSKKRPLDLGQKDESHKKMRIGSSSMPSEEPVPVLLEVELGPDDGMGINDLAQAQGSTSHEDEDDGLYQDPYFVPSSLIPEPELFDSSSEPTEVNESDYLSYLNFLLNEEPLMEGNSEPSEVFDADDLIFVNSFLNEEPLMEENQSTWHDSNIQVTMPTHVF